MACPITQILQIPKSYKVYAISVSNLQRQVTSIMSMLSCAMMVTYPQMKKIFYIKETSALGKVHIHGVILSTRVLSSKSINATYVGWNIFIRKMTHLPRLSYVSAEVVRADRFTPPQRATISGHMVGWLVYMMKNSPVKFTVLTRYVNTKTPLTSLTGTIMTNLVSTITLQNNEIIPIEEIIVDLYRLYY